ncbi:MAG: hypothetical protein M1458_03200 [Deltaproteobacteria bacterium]|nr:hypothetical protein [Deltaproteobacteria bacterium]
MMRVNIRDIKGYLFFFIFLFAACSLAVAPQKGFGLKPKMATALNKPAKPSKINIISDSLVVNNKSGLAIFSGHVNAVDGNLKISSDILHVVYTKKNKIKMLVASGRVRIVKGKDNITGGKAVYYNKTEIAIITKDPVAYEGKNRITGEKIIINFRTGISTVSGSTKRKVNVTVYSNKSLTVRPSKKP